MVDCPNCAALRERVERLTTAGADAWEAWSKPATHGDLVGPMHRLHAALFTPTKEPTTPAQQDALGRLIHAARVVLDNVWGPLDGNDKDHQAVDTVAIEHLKRVMADLAPSTCPTCKPRDHQQEQLSPSPSTWRKEYMDAARQKIAAAVAELLRLQDQDARQAERQRVLGVLDARIAELNLYDNEDNEAAGGELYGYQWLRKHLSQPQQGGNAE